MSKPGGTRDGEQSWEVRREDSKVKGQGHKAEERLFRAGQGEIDRVRENEAVGEGSGEFCKPEFKGFK